MRRKQLALLLVSPFVLALALGVGLAQHDHHADTPHTEKSAATTPDVAASLSPRLRELLDKEMWQIDDGMGTLATGISLGDWKTVAETASKIRDSFILEQRSSHYFKGSRTGSLQYRISPGSSGSWYKSGGCRRQDCYQRAL